MVYINLMPWRQRRRQRQWRVWHLLAIGAVALLMVKAVEGYWQQQLNRLQSGERQRWSEALEQAAALQTRYQFARRQLSERQEVQRRQDERWQELARWFSFLDVLSDGLPPDVWLRSLQKAQRHVVLEGFSRSIGGLEQLRGRLRQWPEASAVTQGALRREPAGEIGFSLSLQLGSLNHD